MPIYADVYLTRYGGGGRAITATGDKRYARTTPRSIYVNTSGDSRTRREAVSKRGLPEVGREPRGGRRGGSGKDPAGPVGPWDGGGGARGERKGGGTRGWTKERNVRSVALAYVTYYLEYAHTSRAGRVFRESVRRSVRLRGSCLSLRA